MQFLVFARDFREGVDDSAPLRSRACRHMLLLRRLRGIPIAMKPTICIVSELPPPPGGMAVQAQLLTENLRREGHLVLNAPTNPLAADSRLRRWRGLRGVVNFQLFLVKLLPACMRADCVHVFSNSYLSFVLFTVPAVTLGQLFGKRVIVHYHGGAASDFLDRWGWLARPTLRRADAVLVPSRFLEEVFSRRGIVTRIVPNVLDLESFPLRVRKPLRPRIIMARHLEHDYNVACGLRAFAQLAGSQPDAHMTVAGDGSERAMLEALARELGVVDRVSFIGNVPNEAMCRLYDEHDIFLNTSRVDNQPISILEAFACGLPVVTTAVGGIPHMVRDGINGLLAPDDNAGEIVARLEALLADQALVERLVHGGRAQVLQSEWASVYGRHLENYANRNILPV